MSKRVFLDTNVSVAAVTKQGLDAGATDPTDLLD